MHPQPFGAPPGVEDPTWARSLAFEHAPLGMAVVSLDGLVQDANARLVRLLGRTLEGVVGKNVADLTHAEDRDLDRARVQELLAGERDRYEVEKRVLHDDGTPLWVLLSVSAVRDGDGGATHLVHQLQDIGELRAARDELEQRALYDPLTGLANRSLFLDRLAAELREGRRKESLAVAYCDLDRFKPINDLHGHATGDLVLAEVGRRLRAALRAGDTAARLGGDEFVVLLSRVPSIRDAQVVMERIRRAVVEPVQVGEHTLRVGMSVGLSIGRHGDEPETVLRHADTALHTAKAGGRGHIVTHDPGGAAPQDHDPATGTSASSDSPPSSGGGPAHGPVRQRRERTRILIESAMAEDRVGIVYQPVVDLVSGRVVGAEALLRVSDADGETLPTNDVISVAEATGLIVDLGRRVLDIAALQAAAWQRDLGKLVPIAVNVSAVQLGQTSFATDVLAAASAAGVPARALSLELTESVLLETGSGELGRLRDLRSAGVELAIDDFGTGYASLSYLRVLPASTLKIDQSFVRGVPHDRRSVAIVMSVIDLARNFDMTCIAEGIEDERQRTFLRGFSTLGQGYLLGRPLPGDELARTLIERHLPRPTRTAAEAARIVQGSGARPA